MGNKLSNEPEMELTYRQFKAEICYLATTRCFYGEIKGFDYLLNFQATKRDDLQSAMRLAVDQFLDQAVHHANI